MHRSGILLSPCQDGAGGCNDEWMLQTALPLHSSYDLSSSLTGGEGGFEKG